MRVPVTIPGNKICGDHLDFPVKLTEVNLPKNMTAGYPNTLIAVDNIKFTEDKKGLIPLHGKVLNYVQGIYADIEMWVTLPSTAEGKDKTFYIWYNSIEEPLVPAVFKDYEFV